MIKKCNKCNVEKEAALYNTDKAKKGGLCTFCIECSTLYKKTWKENNKNKIKAREADWYQKDISGNKEKRRKYYELHRDEILRKNKELYKRDPDISRNSDLKKRYGLTLEQYKEMLSTQNEACAICKQHMSTFSRYLAVDHCHKTGKIRGLLCANCNRALGNLRDSMDNARNALGYLRIHSENK